MTAALKYVVWTRVEDAWETDGEELTPQIALKAARDIQEHGGIPAKALPLGTKPKNTKPADATPEGKK